MEDGHEVSVLAGIGFYGSDFNPGDTSSSSDLFAAPSFSLSGKNSEDEPGVLSPDAQLPDAQLQMEALSGTAKQHMENCLTNDRSIARTLTANIASPQAATQDKSAKTSSDSELIEANSVRQQDARNFSKSEAELMDGVDALQHAISITQQVTMNPALLQRKIGVRSMNNVVTALTAGMDSTADSSVFNQKLVAQCGQSFNADDGELSAPPECGLRGPVTVVDEEGTVEVHDGTVDVGATNKKAPRFSAKSSIRVYIDKGGNKEEKGVCVCVCSVLWVLGLPLACKCQQLPRSRRRG